MIIIGHRGASGHAPEHTFASYDLARGMGADYLEQDLQMTADGVLVVMHDDTLDRTVAGRSGRVIDHTWSELRDCDAGSWFNIMRPDRARPGYAGEPIPTLDEVFARYGSDCSFYVETKNPEEAPGMEEELLALLDRHGLREAAAREWRVLIQSFSEQSLRKIHALDPQLPLIQLLHRRDPQSARFEPRLREIAGYAVGIGPAAADSDSVLVTAAHDHCLHVHPYTVNDGAQMAALADIGVDGIFTDVPDVLLELRPAEEERGRSLLRTASARQRTCREMVMSGAHS